MSWKVHYIMSKVKSIYYISIILAAIISTMGTLLDYLSITIFGFVVFLVATIRILMKNA